VASRQFPTAVEVVKGQLIGFSEVLVRGASPYGHLFALEILPIKKYLQKNAR
jgi:hypothetical protein